MQWEELMKIGREEPDIHLHSVLKTVGVNECCSLVFTVSIVCVVQRDVRGRQTIIIIPKTWSLLTAV
jgi:hypothetical protein